MVGALPLVVLAACADEPTRAVAPDAPGVEHPSPRTLGVVEVTIAGLGSGQATSSALSAASVAELERLRAWRDVEDPGVSGPQPVMSIPDHVEGGGDGTIQLELHSTGSFTDGERGNGGYRYLWATYRVRNAQSDGTPYDTPRRNLTFYAVGTTGTIGQTAVSRLKRFDGSAADPTLASAFVPTGAAIQDSDGAIAPRFPDVLQVVTEEEADAIRDLAGEGVTEIFPYGFVVRRVGSTSTRELPANPAEDQFDGIVTFAFKVPLQASPSDDPFTVSVVFLAVDDDEVRITQSFEEQTPEGRAAFAARAALLGATGVTLLPGGTYDGPLSSRWLCTVRTAGSAASPAGYLVHKLPAKWLSFSPNPYAAGGANESLTRNVQIQANFDEIVLDASAETFVVHGSQGGRRFVGMAYEGNGTTTVKTPAASFFPGEEVEVSITPAVDRCSTGMRRVARYRAKTTGGWSLYYQKDLEVSEDPYTNPYPEAVAVADVDGDGDLDILTANKGAGDVSVLLNQGNWSFTLKGRYAVGGSLSFIATGDLDGDGDPDVVTGTSSGLTVLLNQGDGTLVPGYTYSSSGIGNRIALGDMDADGYLDVVLTVSNVPVVLRNQGNATFVQHATGGQSHGAALALGDIDKDGDLDVVTASGTSVYVFLNQGNGTIVHDATRTVTGISYGAHYVALGDVDKDGDLDVVVAGSLAGYRNVTLLPNQGNGTFYYQFTNNFGLPSNPSALVLGDMDGDGDLDAVVTLSPVGSFTGGVAMRRNNGSGNFGYTDAVTVETGVWATMPALGDLDGDGALDVVVGLNSRTIKLYRNQ